MSASHERPSALTPFQSTIAKLFFTLPASQGYFLVGGAALVAQHLTERPTRDLDLFTSTTPGDVSAARDELEHAVLAAGWTLTRVKDTSTMCRLLIAGDEELLVDLAVDSPPIRPPTISMVGPTLAPQELAGRKLLALFDRAEARDFADVYVLAQQYDKATLLAVAAEIDLGFDARIFRDMLMSLARFTDDEIPVEAAAIGTLRAFFADWAAELE